MYMYVNSDFMSLLYIIADNIFACTVHVHVMKRYKIHDVRRSQ